MSADAAAGLAQVVRATCPAAPAPEWHASCASTNALALVRLASGAPHGTLVIADEQTGGRGRLGRSWHSPAGLGLYVSLVVRSETPLASPTLLVAAAGLAVAEGVEALTAADASGSVDARIKWPNDVWCGERKLAGILVETQRFVPARPAFVVGIGVNVNHSRDDFPADVADTATSLALLTGSPRSPAAVAEAVVAALLARIDQVLRGDTAEVAELQRDYRQRSLVLGRAVSLTVGGSSVRGVVEDVSPIDGLVLRGDDGVVLHVRAEHASEVRLTDAPQSDAPGSDTP